MPTNANGYNSRITDESLEKKFRDSFRSQGGAELVDDLYASGVIVPVIDFSAAASGSDLSQELQQAWDFTTGHSSVVNTTTTMINNAGFWLVDVVCSMKPSSTVSLTGSINMSDGLSTKTIWAMQVSDSGDRAVSSIAEQQFIVFLRSGHSLNAVSPANDVKIEVSYRQIATISGDLVNPSGFTPS